jgi:hypothetical protein
VVTRADYHTTSPGQRVPIVRVITPPTPFVTVDDVKDYLIIEHSDWDTTRIPLALNAAYNLIDGPRGWLGRALADQTLEMSVYACGARRIDLQCPPVIEIVSVVYDDANGDEQTLDSGAYMLKRGAFEAVTSLPTFRELRIRYRAGYLQHSSPTVDPKEWDAAKMAILLLTGDFLRHTTANVANPGVMANPAVEALLAPLRVRTLV